MPYTVQIRPEIRPLVSSQAIRSGDGASPVAPRYEAEIRLLLPTVTRQTMRQVIVLACRRAGPSLEDIYVTHSDIIAEVIAQGFGIAE